MLKRRTVLVATAAAVTAATGLAAPAVAGPPAPVGASGYAFTLLGTVNLPGQLSYGGSRVAGITGADYDPASGTLRLVSADRSNRAPARFFSAQLTVGSGVCALRLVGGVHPLTRPDGTPYPATGPDAADPQAIRYDAASGRVLWASAGDRAAGAAPAVRAATANGAFVAELPRPGNERVDVPGQGPQAGGGYRGLTLSADGSFVASALRWPLLQDGATPVRMTFRDSASGEPLAQFAYQLDALPGNGVAELVTVDESRYLVLEQAPLPNGGNSVRLYEIDPSLGATNLLSEEAPAALAGADYLSLQKRLVLDLADLRIGTVQNLQALTWGPELPDGRRSLLLVSDNGSVGNRSTQVIAVAVALS
ncbi:esterase-like activity of phytase family protein [Micromonospora sp. NPDC093277]|uniref:esterase-like activity of phytase family protein n=1 Tax=Micromonospora sp. NPDC093277 TaxID=3364291 RepID=UPI003811D9C9